MNRRDHDPFAPHEAAQLGPADVDDGDQLDDLKKDELVAEAEKAGLPATGTKADLIGRLREHRSA